ncbi:hypothetical protein EP331_07485 [bacterium]|nr:MAG: hypothetical protein EP331_07485 [bacterium]
MDFNSNSIWDEHRWEAHLNDLEKKSFKKKLFINASWGENEPVWLRFLKEFEDVEEALESYLDDELTYEEAYFPDDVDELGEDDDVDEDIFLSYGEEEEESDEDEYILDPAEELELLNEEAEDVEEGDEWKLSLTEEYSIDSLADETDPFDAYFVYDESRDLSLYFLKRTVEFDEHLTSPIYIEFVQELLHITTKMAAALSFNHEEVQYLGAIITYCKRALKHANKSLEMIKVLKNEAIVTDKEYPVLYTRLFELRNELGLLIQEMREFLESNKS